MVLTRKFVGSQLQNAMVTFPHRAAFSIIHQHFTPIYTVLCLILFMVECTVSELNPMMVTGVHPVIPGLPYLYQVIRPLSASELCYFCFHQFIKQKGQVQSVFHVTT